MLWFFSFTVHNVNHVDTAKYACQSHKAKDILDYEIRETHEKEGQKLKIDVEAYYFSRLSRIS